MTSNAVQASLVNAVIPQQVSVQQQPQPLVDEHQKITDRQAYIDDMRRRAGEYLSAGFAVIPLVPHDKKPSQSGWTKGPMPTEEDLDRWFVPLLRSTDDLLGSDPTGIGIRCGAISGNLFVLDFDERAIIYYPIFRRLVEAKYPGIFNHLRVVKTGRDPEGYHIYVRTTEALPTKLLAAGGKFDASGKPETDARGKPVYVKLIETRGEGAQVVAPGSMSVHDTEKVYVAEGPLNLPQIPLDIARDLLAIAESLDQRTPDERKAAEAFVRNPVDGAYMGKPRAGDVYNQIADPSEILEEAGWTHAGGQNWTRPGKTSGTSATLGYQKGAINADGAKLFFCFSTDTDVEPLKPMKHYNAFQLLAFLKFNGDFEATAKYITEKHEADIEAAQEQHYDGLGAGTILPTPSDKKPSKQVREEINQQLVQANQLKTDPKPKLVEIAVEHGLSDKALFNATTGIFNSEADIEALRTDAVKAVKAAIAKKHELTRRSPSRKSGKREIQIDYQNQVQQVFDDVGSLLIETGSVFSRKQSPVVISDRITPISDDNLVGLLSQWAEFYKISKNQFGTTKSYMTFPQNLGTTWVTNPVETGKLPPISFYTKCPTYTDNWRLTPSGYDSQSGYYYHGPTVQPIQGTKLIDEMLSEFTFANDGSRTNYIAILLTALLMPMFRGERPMATIYGDSPGLGKSLLGKVISTVRDGTEWVTGYESDETEFEKKLCGLVKNGATTIVIDNAKARTKGYRAGSGEIESQLLDRTITANELIFRPLGTNTILTIENSIQFVLTANSPKLSDDLASRSVFINLETRSPKPTFSRSETGLLDWVRANRLTILGELVGMVENWKMLGGCLASPQNRFQSWSRILGGILAANGLTNLMQNQMASLAATSQTALDFFELLSDLVGLHQTASAAGQWATWTTSDLLAMATANGWFVKDLETNHTQRAQVTKLGQSILPQFIGKKDKNGFMFNKGTGPKGDPIYYLSK